MYRYEPARELFLHYGRYNHRCHYGIVRHPHDLKVDGTFDVLGFVTDLPFAETGMYGRVSLCTDGLGRVVVKEESF
jgi:hypothetical protein